MPTILFLLASTGSFDSTISSPAGFPPGSQGRCPCQRDRTASCDGSRDGQAGSRLPFCSGAPTVCSPFAVAPLICAHPLIAAHQVVARRLRARPRLAPNASGLAVAALSAWPSTLAVSSPRAGTAPTTNNAPPCSCASTPEGSTLLARPCFQLRQEVRKHRLM